MTSLFNSMIAESEQKVMISFHFFRKNIKNFNFYDFSERNVYNKKRHKRRHLNTSTDSFIMGQESPHLILVERSRQNMIPNACFFCIEKR